MKLSHLKLHSPTAQGTASILEEQFLINPG